VLTKFHFRSWLNNSGLGFFIFFINTEVGKLLKVRQYGPSSFLHHPHGNDLTWAVYVIASLILRKKQAIAEEILAIDPTWEIPWE